MIIYLHYFILFEISLFTVALKFISDETALPVFAVTCLYGGVVLFYIDLLISNQYNQIIANKTIIVTFTLTTLMVIWQLCFGKFFQYLLSRLQSSR